MLPQEQDARSDKYRHGNRTWRATVPALALTEIVENLIHPTGDTHRVLGIRLNQASIRARIEAGDTLPPEAKDLTRGYPDTASAERITAWFHEHPEAWSHYGPVRVSQWKIKRGSAEFNLTDVPDTFLPHFLLAGAMLRHGKIEIKVTFGLLQTVEMLIEHLNLAETERTALPATAAFGEAFFPVADAGIPEGLFVFGPSRASDARLGPCQVELVGLMSGETVGSYSSDAWWVGFEEPADYPDSHMGADMARLPGEPPAERRREAGVAQAEHLAEFIRQAERFLGHQQSGLQEYVIQLAGK